VTEGNTQARTRTGRDSRWTAAAIPELPGQVAVVTGASAGLGLQTARVLAARGATVVLGCRDTQRAGRAAHRIGAETGADPGRVRIVRLDLASLASVREAAAEIRSRYPRIDLLINNAAVMRPPCQRSADGFELTFATNHLGHFALTGLLLDGILAAGQPRIVTVSSEGHWDGEMCFSDLQFERRGYRADDAYAQSKLANLLFTYELQRRLSGAGTTIAAAAHPGLAGTELTRHTPAVAAFSYALVTQNAAVGALPALRAATDPGVLGGQYYGPGRLFGARGYPELARSSRRSRDTAIGRRLWTVSEELTGVTFPV